MNRCVLLVEGKIDNQEIETYGWGVGRVRKRQEIVASTKEFFCYLHFITSKCSDI